MADRETTTHIDLDFSKGNGLVSAIAQDANSKEVLMCAFMNREAFETTLATGYAHYYSRSRDSLWKKGESSGHLQKIREIRVDCDQDCVLMLVEQTGVACHTGRRSCFYRRAVNTEELDFLDQDKTPGDTSEKA
ncbi:phosphoribosyl-AMP cyclohydrolase [Marispirochaeta aestuarii]|uniref:phosphoribosyl-AMP cyclohydrolase n=1 Tax=Marispirochaeta aestuarii TaxID=1963862 RepID=UPI0029C9A577|nr:phosphoribosyl-AMP cyclohydrolase [Marispirochaeta aestuarii]